MRLPKSPEQRVVVIIGGCAILLAIILIAIATINTTFTGQATQPTEEESTEFSTTDEPSSSEGSPTQEQQLLCSGTQCNPQNSQQICSNGQWISCSADQVCSLGACITPENVRTTTITPFIGGGGGGGSSSSSDGESGGTTLSPEPETTKEIGDLGGSSVVDIAKNEKLIFSIANVQHTIKIAALSSTSATFQLKNGAFVSIEVSQEKSIDDDTSGSNDFIIKLKSVNLASSTAKVLLTQA